MKKIAVIAGTKIDTEQGVTLIKKHFTNELVSQPISSTPTEQTYFQTMEPALRQQKVEAILTTLIDEENVEIFFIYCNSLSASVDFEELAQKYQVPILTPFLFYKELASTYLRIGVLSANAQGAAGIERVIIQENPRARVYSIANIDWVESIEKRRTPSEICSSAGIKESITFFEKNQVECIVFGCTHFPYFFDEYQQLSSINCLHADTYLVNALQGLIF